MLFEVLVFSWLTFVRVLRVSGCDDKCPDKPVFKPARLVVRHGDNASAICTPCVSACNTTDGIGLEVSVGKKGVVDQEDEDRIRQIWWNVVNLIEWELAPTCYYNEEKSDTQCCSKLVVTVYQPPNSVSISYVSHSGPVLEGGQCVLLCVVRDVAPVETLVVTFYRGQAALAPPQYSNNRQKTPVTQIFHLNINPSREDDGVQYWCEARLDLGPEGPQGPEGPHVVKSNNVTASVHYPPLQRASPNPIQITAGDTLQLNCSVTGNPSPSYSWTLPKAPPLSNVSLLTIESVSSDHEGEYACVASNNLGNITVTFNVDVQVDLLPIIAGLGAAAVVVIMGICCFFYTSHHRHTRTGHYRLKDVFRLQRSTHVACPME